MEPLIPYFQVPVLEIPLGNFVIPLHGFGLLVAVGFVVGGKAAMARARRLGLDPEVINRLIGWLVLGTFVGGHVGYGLMYKPEEYLSNPIEFLKFWQGLSSFGGFVACVPIAIWFFRKEKVPVWPFLDCLAYGFAIGWFFGRMGCFVAHDHPGTATEFWTGVYCRPVEGHVLQLPDFLTTEPPPGRPWGPCAESGNVVATHDMGLYEAWWSLAMFGLLTLLDRRAWKPGVFTVLIGLTYAPVRFAMDFLRPESTDARYFGFTPGQYWSTVLLVVCIAALVWRMRSSDAPIEPSSDDVPEPAGGSAGG